MQQMSQVLRDHADCRDVHQSCCPWIECSFLYHKPSPKTFQRIWQYIQPPSQLQTTCDQTIPGPPHPQFYWWHFECSEITWRDPEAHCCVPFFQTITLYCSMIMQGPMLQGSVHNSWMLKISQFMHGQHTHQTCHPLSMFGMLWIDVYDSVFQFQPISSNFHRPQSTTWSTLCEGDVLLHCVKQMVVTPDTDWFLDPANPKIELHILEWPFIVASL